MANTNTVNIPPNANAHQNQLPARPFSAIRPVTASGVSAANVVATIDVPAIHHGRLRPETKNSTKLLSALPLNHRPMPRLTAK